MFSTVLSSISCYPSPLPPPFSPAQSRNNDGYEPFSFDFPYQTDQHFIALHIMCVCVCSLSVVRKVVWWKYHLHINCCVCFPCSASSLSSGVWLAPELDLSTVQPNGKHVAVYEPWEFPPGICSKFTRKIAVATGPYINNLMLDLNIIHT